MIKEEIRFQDSNIFEGMTSISALLDAREKGKNNREIKEILFDAAKASSKARKLSFLRAKCTELGIPLTMTDAQKINSLTVGNTHGGVIAVCGERTLPELCPENLPAGAFLAYLDGIEDPYNFGYALRSLYAAGCDGVLVGERSWMSAAGVVARASAGTSELLPLFRCEPLAAAELLRAHGYRVVCAGIPNSVSYEQSDLKKPLLLVIGGEKRGISAGLLALADTVVRIDYGRDFRGSLSTAAATAILAFEVLRQNRV